MVRGRAYSRSFAFENAFRDVLPKTLANYTTKNSSAAPSRFWRRQWDDLVSVIIYGLRKTLQAALRLHRETGSVRESRKN
jgi:hypothetical protein